MKSLLKRAFQRLSRVMLNEAEERLYREAVVQKALMQQYRSQASGDRGGLLSLKDVGFRKYSQFEEDGILLYIFSLSSPTNRVCVELCAGDGRTCNTANLIINHGWWGHLFDGLEAHVRLGKAFYSQLADTCFYPPRFTHAWITAENVNELILGSGATGSIDLLSLDVDGNDYWIWKAIDVIQPRVLVCEVNRVIPPDKSLTIPYDAAFIADPGIYTGASFFNGASLKAMCRLSKEKGYRLVGASRHGVNVFFVRCGIAEDLLPAVDVDSCQQDPSTREVRSAGWPKAQFYPWQEV